MACSRYSKNGKFFVHRDGKRLPFNLCKERERQESRSGKNAGAARERERQESGSGKRAGAVRTRER